MEIMKELSPKSSLWIHDSVESMDSGWRNEPGGFFWGSQLEGYKMWRLSVVGEVSFLGLDMEHSLETSFCRT